MFHRSRFYLYAEKIVSPISDQPVSNNVTSTAPQVKHWRLLLTGIIMGADMSTAL